MEPSTPRLGDCEILLVPSTGEVDRQIAAPSAFGPQRAPASAKATKSANGSMVETRFQKPGMGRHGDGGTKNTTSLDETGLLMEAGFGLEALLG